MNVSHVALQGSMLQSCSYKSPSDISWPKKFVHEAPPCCADWVTVYVLVCFPPPHCAEHSLHVDQDPTQLMGQGDKFSHSLIAVSPFDASQIPEPCAGVVTLKERVCIVLAGPQDGHSLHSDQDPTQFLSSTQVLPTLVYPDAHSLHESAKGSAFVAVPASHVLHTPTFVVLL